MSVPTAAKGTSTSAARGSRITGREKRPTRIAGKDQTSRSYDARSDNIAAQNLRAKGDLLSNAERPLIERVEDARDSEATEGPPSASERPTGQGKRTEATEYVVRREIAIAPIRGERGQGCCKRLLFCVVGRLETYRGRPQERA